MSAPILFGSELACAALDFATGAHAGQFRRDKKTPYIEHPKAVANLFQTHWMEESRWHRYPLGEGINDYHRGVALCYLHDVREETPTLTSNDLADAGLGVVCHGLRVLTHTKDASYLDYILAIRHAWLIDGYVLPLLVKLCDMEHNSQTATPAQRVKYELAEYILTQ